MAKTVHCIDCMWNWQDVYGGTDRICYNRLSAHFHQVAPERRCKKFEHRPQIKKLWRINNNSPKQKGEGKS